MPLQSGLASQIGYIDEITYGSRLAPTRFLEMESEGLTFDQGRRESKAMRSGQRTLRSDRWSASKKSGGGPIRHNVSNKGFGLLFKHMLGAIASTQPNAGPDPTVWEHKATVGDPKGKSLTIQVGRPGNDGTVRPFDYTGSKVVGWKLSTALDGELSMELNIDAQDESDTQTLATVSYPTSQTEFEWTNLVFKIAGSVFDVSSFALEGNPALKLDRYFVGARTKKEPLANALSMFQGSVVGEFVDLTAYDRIRNGTVVAVTAFWTGALISGAFNFAVEVTMPAVRFDGDTPTADSFDVISQPLKFKALDDGTANSPIAIVYRTTDTTP